LTINEGEDRLHGLDQLRGVAALLVLFYHVHTNFGGFELFARSYLAVDFFFMLSGFVMARTYEGRLRSGALSALSFFVIRFRRLWAPIAAGTIIGFFLVVIDGRLLSGLIALIPGLFLLPNLMLDRPYLLNRPAWSIFFELFANVLHALILYRLRTGSLLILSLAFAALLYWYCAEMGGIFVGFRSHDFLMGIPRVLVSYLIGIALCRAKLVFPALPSIATLMLATSLLFLPEGAFWDLAFILAICPFVLVLGRSVSASKYGVAVGTLSFPLYAVHMPVLEAARSGEAHPLFASALAILVAVLVGFGLGRLHLLRRLGASRSLARSK
jgi:peptidoglycan/LPS O-acetylase OafA/YrhL